MEIIIICFVLVTEGFSRFETSYIIRWLSLWAWIFNLPMAFFQSRNSTFTNEFLVLLCVILILESNAQRTVSSIFRHWITKPWKSVIPYMGDHVYSWDILAVFLGGGFCVCFLCGFCFCFCFCRDMDIPMFFIRKIILMTPVCMVRFCQFFCHFFTVSVSTTTWSCYWCWGWWNTRYITWSILYDDYYQ